jgi:hypothetical protein
MDKSNRFRNLRFEPKAWFLNPRLVTVGIILAMFSLGWLIIPLNFLFFLLLLPIAGIVWAASYGWRHALSILLDWLHRLERL